MLLNDMTASAAAAAIARGDVSSEDLVRACLARIAAREPLIRAFAHVDIEGAIAAGRDADKAVLLADGPLGPLHGVPFAVKDVIETQGVPTRHNSLIYKNYVPGKDAACVAILKGAGAILIGKAETIEFAAHGRNALTRNPHDPRRTPGGSSSGSAAAVADAMVPLSLGTQTGGSLIRPASFCGTFAMKPTFGTVSTEGAKLFANSLDTIGWYARAVEDLELLADVFEISSDPRRSAVPPRELRLGFCRTPYWIDASDAMRSAFERCVEALRAKGISVEEVELGPEFDDANTFKELIMRGEGRVAFLDLQASVPHLLSPGIVRRMDRKDDRDLRQALDQAALLRIAFDRIAAPYDAILTPASTGAAPEGLAYAGNPIFNGLWTMLHVPAIALPVLQPDGTMPQGLQLVGQRYSDRRLLAAASALGAVLRGGQPEQTQDPGLPDQG